MTRIAFHQFILFALCSALGGCLARDPEVAPKNVTQNPKYWGGYKPNGRYVTLTDLYLNWNELSEPEPNSRFTTVTGTEVPSPSFQDYEASPEKWPHIAGVVPSGTVITVRLFGILSTTEESHLNVVAQVMTGQFAGRMVELRNVSRSYYGDATDGFTLKPNEKDLRELEK